VDTETNPTTPTTNETEIHQAIMDAEEYMRTSMASRAGGVWDIDALEEIMSSEDVPPTPPSPYGERIQAMWHNGTDELEYRDITTTSEEPAWSEVTDGQYRVAVELDESLAVPAMEYYNRAQRRAMARRNNGFNAFEFAQEYGSDVINPFGSSVVEEGKEVNVKNKSKNKRLAEWSISARALKDMINRIVEEGQSPQRADFFSAYKFGAYFAPRYRRWFIYNKATANNIATIKVSDGRLIVRYRPNSFYSSVLSDIQVENVKTIAVESANMHRHNRLVSGYSDDIEASKDGEMRFRKERYARKHNR